MYSATTEGHTPPPAISARGLRKRFGETQALDGIDFNVVAGTVTALLGPNGAGKTTAVRVLTTLLRADEGSAEVAGIDVASRPGDVRTMIGLTGQFTAIDELLTGRENLVMIGRLARVPKDAVAPRAADLLKRFSLDDAADRPAGTYSGGMRRRLDLAASLIAEPSILFLDEPTTGLDPRSRIAMWSLIEELVERGTTVLLTTQYLDEADQLADQIVVIDHGRVIAQGTAAELKAETGGERLLVRLESGADPEAAASALRAAGAETGEIDAAERTVTALLTRGPKEVAELINALDAAGIAMAEVEVQRPTLDDVFLSLTGEHVEGENGADQEVEQ